MKKILSLLLFCVVVAVLVSCRKDKGTLTSLTLKETHLTLVEGECASIPISYGIAREVSGSECPVCNDSVSDDAVSHDNADIQLTYTSSAPDIVAVIDGFVNALAPGQATITVTAGDKSASCVIDVMPAMTDSVKNVISEN